MILNNFTWARTHSSKYNNHYKIYSFMMSLAWRHLSKIYTYTFREIIHTRVFFFEIWFIPNKQWKQISKNCNFLSTFARRLLAQRQKLVSAVEKNEFSFVSIVTFIISNISISKLSPFYYASQVLQIKIRSIV